VKPNKQTNGKYDKAIFIRLDADTLGAIESIMAKTERGKSDAVRWAIRKMAARLSTGKVA
jgi:hypothetical protein